MINKKDQFKKLIDDQWIRALLVFFGILFVFGLWWAISLLANNSIFPSPSDVIPAFFAYTIEGKTYLAIGGTLLRLISSFLFSFLIAFLLGVISGLNKAIRTFLKPFVLVLRTIPTAALILSMIVFLKPKMALFIIVFLIMFPILYESIVSGIVNIDKEIINALRIDSGLHNPKALFKVIIPCARPYINLGIIQTIGLGMKVSLMAEILVGQTTLPGLGVLIKNAYNNGADMVSIFAYSIYAIMLTGIIDLILKITKSKIKK